CPHASDAGTRKSEADHPDYRTGCQEEPPSPPYRRQHPEARRSRQLAQCAVRPYRPHQEAVGTGRQIRISHDALIAGCTPVQGRAFQLVLITERFARGEAEAREFDLNVILVGPELRPGDADGARLWERKRNPGDMKSCYENRRRRSRLFRLRVES